MLLVDAMMSLGLVVAAINGLPDRGSGFTKIYRWQLAESHTESGEVV